ncbi:MAG TPA: hypothetical protein VF634_12025 [Pyrinomonadaceae bacterium]|jgi:hypothetical protein
MAFNSAAAQQPTTVVAVNLKSPEFTVKELKYRVFYNQAQMKRVPLLDYDFKAALSDELLNALAEDTRMKWRPQAENEVIDVFGVQKNKVRLPPLEADRVLLVSVEDFGAFMVSLMPDKFYLQAKFKLIDRATGKKLWEKKLFVTEELDGKLKELQAENQKGLKLGVNKVLERITRKMVADLRLARI